MKLHYLFPALLLVGCAASHPTTVDVGPGPLPQKHDVSDPASIRKPEQVKAYPVGRYADPNDPDVMHEGHTVYRAETSPEWDTDPNEPTSLPLGPGEMATAEVLALSDGLVLTASLNAEAAEMMTPYDLLMSFVGELLEAQAFCAIHGIFLRGGISKGLFYFEDSILLSPALVRAYKMESQKAVYPIILIESKLIRELRSLQGRKHYAKDADPSLSYFREFESPEKEESSFYYLDYLAHLSSPASHTWLEDEDRLAYLAEKNSQKRQQILDQSYSAAAARAMGRHKDEVLKAYHAATRQDVKEKYCWLMRYHNAAIEGFIPVFDPARIEIP